MNSKSMDRRSFLRKATRAGAAVGAGLALPSISSASSWGEIPGGSSWGFNPRKILHCMLPGGNSIWENFWVTDNFDFAGYANDVANLDWGCAGAPAPGDVIAFDDDQQAQSIYWGPATKPLWASYIINYTRMITLTLSQVNPPHEIGQPRMVGGRGIGHPKLASLASAIEHRFQEWVPRDTPYSCVIAPQTGATNLLRSLLMGSGMHPPWAKPLMLKLGLGESALKQQLDRAHATNSSDALFDIYRSQYRDLLRFQGEGPPLASRGFDSFDHASNMIFKSWEIDNLLSDDLLQVDAEAPCAIDPPNPLLGNTTETGLRLAAHLLSLPHDQGGMRYVGVVDGGLRAAPGGAGMPYDAHTSQNVAVTSSNLWNLLSNLSQIIQQPGPVFGAGPQTPGPKIDLSDTAVLITSEFGRNPATKENGGRDHWGTGFVGLAITNLANRGITGALVNHVADSDHQYSPLDMCAFGMLLAGVWPFETENFEPQELSSDLREGDTDPDDVANKIKQKFLG